MSVGSPLTGVGVRDRFPRIGYGYRYSPYDNDDANDDEKEIQTVVSLGGVRSVRIGLSSVGLSESERLQIKFSLTKFADSLSTSMQLPSLSSPRESDSADDIFNLELTDCAASDTVDTKEPMPELPSTPLIGLSVAPVVVGATATPTKLSQGDDDDDSGGGVDVVIKPIAPLPPLFVDNMNNGKKSSLLCEDGPLPASPPVVVQQRCHAGCIDLRNRQCQMVLNMLHPDNSRFSLSRALQGRPATKVGQGNYGHVFGVRVDQILLAIVKVVRHDEYRPRSPSGDGTLVRAEPVITSTLTRSLMFDDVHRCPNFLATLAFDVTSYPIKFGRPESPNETSKLPLDLIACQARQQSDRMHVQMISECCVGGTLIGHLTELAEDPVAFSNGSDLDMAEAFVGSLVAQILMAITCGGSIGVVHNDLTLRNVFVRFPKTDDDSVLQYDLDDDTTLFVPTGRKIPLIVVGDYGMSSVVGARDSRLDVVLKCFPDCPDDVRAAYLSYYYYDEVPDEDGVSILRGIGDRMLMSNIGDEHAHYRPLMFVDIGHYERDFSSILSGLYMFAKTYSEEARARGKSVYWCECMRDFCRDLLDILAAQRPDCYEKQIKFVRTAFYTSHMFFSWMLPSTKRVINHCRLPTKTEAADIHVELIRSLSTPLCAERRCLVSMQQPSQ
jgi:hypothetical protein